MNTKAFLVSIVVLSAMSVIGCSTEVEQPGGDEIVVPEAPAVELKSCSTALGEVSYAYYPQFSCTTSGARGACIAKYGSRNGTVYGVNAGYVPVMCMAYCYQRICGVGCPC